VGDEVLTKSSPRAHMVMIRRVKGSGSQGADEGAEGTSKENRTRGGRQKGRSKKFASKCREKLGGGPRIFKKLKQRTGNRGREKNGRKLGEGAAGWVEKIKYKVQGAKNEKESLKKRTKKKGGDQSLGIPARRAATGTGGPYTASLGLKGRPWRLPLKANLPTAG